jgi:hypothetical protein
MDATYGDTKGIKSEAVIQCNEGQSMQWSKEKGQNEARWSTRQYTEN